MNKDKHAKSIYQAPKVLKLDETESAYGVCEPGSSPGDSCGPGNNATGCGSPGNSATSACGGPGNTPRGTPQLGSSQSP